MTTKQISQMIMRAFAGIIASVVIGLAFPAYAADGTWTNLASNGLWSNTANWQEGTIADGSGFTANFNTLNLTADNTVKMDASHTLGNLIFGDTASSSGWILDNNGNTANILTLAGGTPTITVNALASGKTATISTIIEGSAGLTKAGTGTLTLSGANTYTGTTTISAGTLTFASGGSTGSGSLVLSTSTSVTVNVLGVNNFGAITFNSTGTSLNLNSFGSSTGTITFGGGNNVKEYIIYTGSGETTDRALTLTSGGAGSNVTLEHSGSGLLKFTGAITRNGNLTCGLTLQGSTEGVGEVSGIIANPGGFLPVTKQGSGTWILSGANTYSRDTTISGGTLLVNNTSGSGTGSAAVNVATNATLGGIGMITGTVTVANGGILSPGTNSVGTLTVGTLKLNANATFAVEINGASSYDCCVVSQGTVDIASSLLSLTVAPGYVPKFQETFTIIRNVKGDAVTGTFANGATIMATGLPMPFEISTTGGAGNDVVLRYTGGGGTMIRFM